MCQSNGVLPCFRAPAVNVPQLIDPQTTLGKKHVPLMYRVSEEKYPDSVEERAEQIRAVYRRLGIPVPGEAEE